MNSGTKITPSFQRVSHGFTDKAIWEEGDIGALPATPTGGSTGSIDFAFWLNSTGDLRGTIRLRFSSQAPYWTVRTTARAQPGIF